MTAKQIVIQKYPKAVAVQYPEDWGWCIFKKPPTTGPAKGALNLLSGYSQGQAWKAAADEVSKKYRITGCNLCKRARSCVETEEKQTTIKDRL